MGLIVVDLVVKVVAFVAGFGVDVELAVQHIIGTVPTNPLQNCGIICC